MYVCSRCNSEVSQVVHTEGMDLLNSKHFSKDEKDNICLNCFVKDSGVKTLYHLSLSSEIIDFYPRVPKIRRFGEDGLINRISASDTIDGCLSAVPWGGTNLEEAFLFAKSKDKGLSVRVYEFDIDDIGFEFIVPPEYLFQEDLVGDAYETGEHWIMSHVQPYRTYIITILSFDEDYEIDISYQDVLDCKNGDKEWEDADTFVTIKNLKFEVLGESMEYFNEGYDEDGPYEWE